jgi:L-fucose mutarotase/ribose pyranase (RbsD/FucU family)
MPERVREFQEAAQEVQGRRINIKMSLIDRFSFYERPKSAFAIAPTTEHGLYLACSQKEGVVRPRWTRKPRTVLGTRTTRPASD